MLLVLATLVICKRGTLDGEAVGMVGFTVGGMATSILTYVVDTNLTGKTGT